MGRRWRPTCKRKTQGERQSPETPGERWEPTEHPLRSQELQILCYPHSPNLSPTASKFWMQSRKRDFFSSMTWHLRSWAEVNTDPEERIGVWFMSSLWGGRLEAKQGGIPGPTYLDLQSNIFVEAERKSVNFWHHVKIWYFLSKHQGSQKFINENSMVPFLKIYKLSLE